MRLAIVVYLIFLCLPAGAIRTCDVDHDEFAVHQSQQLRLSSPDPQLPLVELSTGTGFVLVAEQSKFIPVADYRESEQEGLGPYKFYWWLRSRQPIDVIDLDKFDRPSRKHYYMMQLIEDGAFYVRIAESESFLESVHVEWYSCEYGSVGGRRLRTDGGATVYWYPEWIS